MSSGRLENLETLLQITEETNQTLLEEIAVHEKEKEHLLLKEQVANQVIEQLTKMIELLQTRDNVREENFLRLKNSNQLLNTKVNQLFLLNQELMQMAAESVEFSEEIFHFRLYSQKINDELDKNHDIQRLENKISHLFKELNHLPEHGNQNFENQRQQLEGQLKETIQELVSHEEVRKISENIEEKLASAIAASQDQLATEIEELRYQQNQIVDKLDPVYHDYEEKINVLEIQKELLENDDTADFYNTIYKILASKLYACTILYSRMIKAEETKVEKVGKYVGAGVGAAASIVPGLGGVLGGFAPLLIDEATGWYANKKNEKKVNNVTDSVISPNRAIEIAELIARRITVSKRDKLVSEKTNHLEEAKCYAIAFFHYWKEGNMLPHRNKPVETQVDIAIQHFNDHPEDLKNFLKDEPSLQGVMPQVIVQEQTKIEKKVVYNNIGTGKTLRGKVEFMEKHLNVHDQIAGKQINTMENKMTSLTDSLRELNRTMKEQNKTIDILKSDIEELKKQIKMTTHEPQIRPRSSTSDPSEKALTKIRFLEETLSEQKSAREALEREIILLRKDLSQLLTQQKPDVPKKGFGLFGFKSN